MVQPDPNILVLPPDPYADDPFFKRNLDTNWNACIGQQGHEENYVDGYIEAAKELAGAVIDKKMYAKRDTLVLPILYNARHALELALKFATDRLVEAGLLRPIARNHNIRVYWERLNDASLGDEKLSQTIGALKSFIDSLSRIDNDGQELRYHVNSSNDSSLQGYSLANLEIIRDSLSRLSDVLEVLRYRTMGYLDERTTGAFTSRCSRRDLFTIAQLVPRRDFWRAPLFDQQKALVRNRFRLSNKQFSKALDAIQNNREMRGVLGLETDLLHNSDDDIVWLVEQWRRIHPQIREDSDGYKAIAFDEARIDQLRQYLKTKAQVIGDIEQRIIGDKLAEVEAMFYLARDRLFSEHHERRTKETRREHEIANNPKIEIGHLMEKTNFLDCMQEAAKKLGRLSLANRLAKL